MIQRQLHRLEQYTLALNVSVGFIVSTTEKTSKEDIVEALTRTTDTIPVLSCAIVMQEDGTAHFGPRSIPIEDTVVVEHQQTSLPSLQEASQQLADVARGLSDISTHLFDLKAVVYEDGVVFLLAVNHAITDGTSVFTVVDTFLQHICSLNTSYTPSLPSPSDRDLVAELLADDRCISEVKPFAQPPDILKFPPLSEQNIDAVNSGCFRVVFRELSAPTTSALLKNCRLHQVGFQALLSTLGALALLKLTHTTNSTVWSQPIGHIIPVNMRRYLQKDDWPVERVSAMASVSLPWTAPAYESFASLVGRDFWSLVKNDAQIPINATLESDYLHHSLHTGEKHNSHGSVAYSLVTTSLGNIETVKQCYGNMRVVDACMQAGFYAQSQSQYDNPTIPSVVLESGMSGHAWIHAYTIFGRLKLTGEYCLYSREFVSQYYDEVVRLLEVVASDAGLRELLPVGDMLSWSA